MRRVAGIRKHEAIAGVLLIVAVSGMVALVFLRPAGSSGVSASIAQIEPAGVFEGNGEEMLMVTLSVANISGGNRCFFAKDDRPVEAKISGRWVPLEGTIWTTPSDANRFPGTRSEAIILVPAHTESCRFRLRYTFAVMNEITAMNLARRLPTWVPFYRQLSNWLNV